MLQSFDAVWGPSVFCLLIRQFRMHSYDGQFHPLPFVVYTLTYGSVVPRGSPRASLGTGAPRPRCWKRAAQRGRERLGEALLSSQTRGSEAGGSACYSTWCCRGGFGPAVSES